MRYSVIALMAVSLHACDQRLNGKTESTDQNQKNVYAEDRPTLLKYLKVDVGDIEIIVDRAHETGTFQKIKTDDEDVLKSIKDSLESYVIVSLEESRNVIVHLLGGGGIDFRLIFKDGREVKVSKLNFMKAKYLAKKDPPVYNEIILAPKEWLKSARKSGKDADAVDYEDYH